MYGNTCEPFSSPQEGYKYKVFIKLGNEDFELNKIIKSIQFGLQGEKNSPEEIESAHEIAIDNQNVIEFEVNDPKVHRVQITLNYTDAFVSLSGEKSFKRMIHTLGNKDGKAETRVKTLKLKDPSEKKEATKVEDL